jgi:hypothetical protein
VPIECFRPTIPPPAPCLGENPRFRLDCAPSLARDAIPCTRCGNTWSEDIIDGICSLCACIPQEDWELPFEWTAQGSSMENTCGSSTNNTDISSTLNPNSTNDDWMFRDFITPERTPAGESNFDIRSFGSSSSRNNHDQRSSTPSFVRLEMQSDVYVYPTVECESVGLSLEANMGSEGCVFNMWSKSQMVYPPSSKSTTQEKVPAGELTSGNHSFESIPQGYNNEHDQNSTAESLEFPTHVYPTLERERAGCSICPNGKAPMGGMAWGKNLTTRISASHRQVPPLKKAETKFRAYFV